MKQLIVNADDFGRTPGVNRGILEAHRDGIVTSTTVMINYPDAAPGLELAQRDAPNLGIGLHVNLTAGVPVSSPHHVPTLVDDDGHFHHISRWRELFDTLAAEDIQREIAAQVDRFVALTGHPPDHLDAHHHAAYLHPAALRAMLEIAAGYGLPLRRGMPDVPPEQAAAHLSHIVPGFDEPFARRLLDQIEDVLADAPAPCWPDHFEMGFYDRTATLADLLILLTNLPDKGVTEIMCHPGYVDEGLSSSGYRNPREREIIYLTHPATRECVLAEGIQLIPFSALVCK